MPIPIVEVAPAVRGDFYGVTGQGIPPDAKLVFQTAAGAVSVKPKVVRPHWAFLPKLPTKVPLGANTIRLQAPGWASDPLNVNVAANPKSTVRVLYPGAVKAAPYTIAFVANPAVASATGAVFHADPVLAQRARFHTTVGKAIKQLVGLQEGLLQQFDDQICFVSVFDAAAPASDATALLKRIPGEPDMLDPRSDKLGPFLQNHGVVADVVFVLHDDAQFDRARSQFTTDDPNGASTPVNFVPVNGAGAPRSHGHFALTPGAVALPLGVDSPTALHEFCHAASDFNNGLVIDLYVDDPLPGHAGSFTVNKQWRNRSTDPVPAGFATYQGANYSSDPDRDGEGYDNGWTSYHPQLVSVRRVNLMDDYYLSGSPAKCRLDKLTHAWLSDRLRAKVTR